MPSLSMTRPCSSRWNSRKSPESSAPPPLKGASRPVAVRVKVSAVRVGRARRRMPPPPPSRRETAAACGGAPRDRRGEDIGEGTRRRSPRASVGRTGTMCALGRSARSCCGRRPSPIVVPREKAKRRRRRTPPPSVCRPRANSRRAVDLENARGDLGPLTLTTKRPDSRTRGATRVFAKTASTGAKPRQPPGGRARSWPTALSGPTIEVFPPASTAKEVPRSADMARPMTVALTEDERKKFDDIGLDDINAMTDVNQLNKLAKYMECVFSPPVRPDLARDRSGRSSIPDMDGRAVAVRRRDAKHARLPFSRAERHSETRRAVTRREGTHATETETETD